MQVKFAPKAQEEIKPSTSGNQLADIKRDVNIPPAFNNGTSNISIDQYNNLVARLEKLEKSFNKYRKAQLMKTVMELGIPVILAIIIAIIFFSSGLFDSLSMLTSMV
jgi:hypothetical protein